MEHPTLTRARDVAHRCGSTANTARGILSFLSASSVAALAPLWFPEIGPSPQPGMAAKNRWIANEHALAWKRYEANRKSNPDVKRCRDDNRFRKRMLAGLLRRERKLCVSNDGSIRAIMEAADNATGIGMELNEIAKLRGRITGKKYTAALPAKIGGILIPIDAPAARKVGYQCDMRGKDATVTAIRGASHGDHSDPHYVWRDGGGEVDPKYLPAVAKDGRAEYVRAQHDNYVRSFGVIVDDRTLSCVFHTRFVDVTLPEGYAWDATGSTRYPLRVVRLDSRQDDYHITADDLLVRNTAAVLVAKLESNRQRRLKLAAERAVEIAEAQGIFVCFRDSVRAGNCPVGTRDFAKRHHLDVSRHYSAAELLTMANGEHGRVRLVVTSARLRHEREMQAGFCRLEDHR